MSRVPVHKTLKMYMKGAFSRSESGRTLVATAHDGGKINVCSASRKDLRDTIDHARGALGPWAGRTAYNRGQILYRLGEMLEGRVDALPTTRDDAEAAADRAVHHSGWADKVTALMSTLNPVALAYVNYSLIRPVGLVVAVPDPKDRLLGMVEAIGAVTVMANCATLLVPPENAELAVALAECVATSDMPAGVVNLLTGDVPAMLRDALKHDDVDAVYLAKGALNADLVREVGVENARVLRRVRWVEGAAAPASPIELVALAEVQTVWMSSLEMRGGGPAY